MRRLAAAATGLAVVALGLTACLPTPDDLDLAPPRTDTRPEPDSPGALSFDTAARSCGHELGDRGSAFSERGAILTIRIDNVVEINDDAPAGDTATIAEAICALDLLGMPTEGEDAVLDFLAVGSPIAYSWDEFSMTMTSESEPAVAQLVLTPNRY